MTTIQTKMKIVTTPKMTKKIGTLGIIGVILRVGMIVMVRRILGFIGGDGRIEGCQGDGVEEGG
jgi:hypothetical protein